MKKLSESKRLREAVTAASGAVWMVDWSTTFGIPHGACIPIAVFTTAYLCEAGISARVVEAGARFTDPLSKRYAEMESGYELSLDAQDEKGLPFLGHAVVQVPSHRAVLDLSLPTQKSKVIQSLGTVDVLVGEVDHTKGHVGFKTLYGRGHAVYRIYPKRDGWSKRNWPYEDIRALARRAYESLGEFEDLKDVKFQTEER